MLHPVRASDGSAATNVMSRSGHLLDNAQKHADIVGRTSLVRSDPNVLYACALASLTAKSTFRHALRAVFASLKARGPEEYDVTKCYGNFRGIRSAIAGDGQRVQALFAETFHEYVDSRE